LQSWWSFSITPEGGGWGVKGLLPCILLTAKMRAKNNPLTLANSNLKVGLELVIVVALRNRDRLLLIWPLVHDMMSTILARESARTANPIVRRATLGLLRICR